MSCGRGLVTGWPTTVTVPEVGCSMPPMMLSSVLLPQPEGPRRQTNSPLRISSETSSSACTLCAASRPANVIDTWSTTTGGDSLRVDPEGAAAALVSAITSELHRHELVVVDGLRLRHEVQDAEGFQRIADH